MSNDKITGVFVRLHDGKLSDQQTADLNDQSMTSLESLLAIGTPVAGGELEVVGYAHCVNGKIVTLGTYRAPDVSSGISVTSEPLVRQSDARAKLAEKDAEIARLEESIQHSKRQQFNAGYLLACCNISNMHNAESIASDVLNELGITEDEVKALDLSEYDAKALNKIRKARGNDQS